MADAPNIPNDETIVATYFQRNYRVVMWPGTGDAKGPHEPGWQHKPYTLEDYQPGTRVGLLTGVAIGPHKYIHDLDIDWAPGYKIAARILPSTEFVFGRHSKYISHCLYTHPEAIRSQRFEDPVDKSVIIELRGTKADGEIGMQTMVPPSVWSKNGSQEPLQFRKFGHPQFYEDVEAWRRRVIMAASSMLIAKYIPKSGFGHEARLEFAGWLLRKGFTADEVTTMGQAIIEHTGNKDFKDMALVVTTTERALASEKNKKVKGAPSFVQTLGEHGKAIINRIHTWLGLNEDFARSSTGAIFKDHQGNIRRALDLMGIEMSYDLFSERMLMNGKLVTDDMIDHTWMQIDEQFQFRPTYEFFYRFIRMLTHTKEFHPVRDYLSSLTWDKVPRIDTWLVEAGHADDTPYVRAVSAIFLIAAVRRMREPGCKYDEMIILESAQGRLKSTAARTLCPSPDWFLDDLNLNVSSQKLIEATLGKWIVEASDLAGKRKTELEQLKAMLSRQVDGPVRMAYARVPVERKRQFVLIGTTNSDSYLNDPTGGRRFWPVRIYDTFDIEWIAQHRDQLWAEAAYREAKGESIRLHSRYWPEATIQQELRREIDPWEIDIRTLLIDRWEAIPTSTLEEHKVVRVAYDEIWQALNLPVERRDFTCGRRINAIMNRFGMVGKSVRYSGKVAWGYVQKIRGKGGALFLHTVLSKDDHEEDLVGADHAKKDLEF